MALPKKTLYSVDEAATYIRKATHERVSIAFVLDWGMQDLFGLYVSANTHVTYKGSSEIFETKAALVKFVPDPIQMQTLVSGYAVEISSGSIDGRECRFMGRDYGSRWQETNYIFNISSVTILGSELERFVLSHVAQATVDPKTNSTIASDIDPSDLPRELDAAMMAFRAVTNGYGDTSATFKNRLIDYLEKSFEHLGKEAIQRIAIVANPDKSTGRKKSIKE
jgi:hypothetical protein